MTTKLFDFDADFGLNYDKIVRSAFFGYEQLFNMTTVWLKSRLGSDARVLVVGCGSGMELITFGEQMLNWHLTGIDPSKQMVGISRERVEQHGLSNRVQVIQGYAGDLPESEIYDAATLILVFHFVPDEAGKLALLKDVASRLRPSGTLILLSPHGDPSRPEDQEGFAVWKSFMISNGMSQAMADQVEKQAIAMGQFTPTSLSLALMEQAGFTDVKLFYHAFVTYGWIARKG